MTKRHLTKTERDVAVFALRYALPRHTGALDEVIAEVKPYIDDFASWEIVDMMRDCRMYYPTADFGGAEKQRRDFKRWSKIAKAYELAFDRMVKIRRAKGLETEWTSGKDVMEWWLKKDSGVKADTASIPLFGLMMDESDT